MREELRLCHMNKLLSLMTNKRRSLLHRYQKRVRSIRLWSEPNAERQSDVPRMVGAIVLNRAMSGYIIAEVGFEEGIDMRQQLVLHPYSSAHRPLPWRPNNVMRFGEYNRVTWSMLIVACIHIPCCFTPRSGKSSCRLPVA